MAFALVAFMEALLLDEYRTQRHRVGHPLDDADAPRQRDDLVGPHANVELAVVRAQSGYLLGNKIFGLV